MKITDVRVQRYMWPRPQPISNGKYTYVNVHQNLIHIETDEGVTGVGWGGGTASGQGSNLTSNMVDHFKSILIGEDPFNYRRIWGEMWQPKLIGRRGLSTRIISGIDIALWDLMGKAVNKPVHKLLGGYRDKIPTYIVLRVAITKRVRGSKSWRKRWKRIWRWEPRRSR